MAEQWNDEVGHTVQSHVRVWKHGGNFDVCSKRFDPAKEQHVAPIVRKALLLRVSVAHFPFFRVFESADMSSFVLVISATPCRTSLWISLSCAWSPFRLHGDAVDSHWLFEEGPFCGQGCYRPRVCLGCCLSSWNMCARHSFLVCRAEKPCFHPW